MTKSKFYESNKSDPAVSFTPLSKKINHDLIPPEKNAFPKL